MNQALKDLIAHVRGSRSTQLTLVIALLVNVVLFAAWAWSHGGQTTHVRIESRANLFAVYIDGQLESGAALAAPEAGSIVLTLDDTKAIPSLPSPRGIDAIRVTDLDSGQVLLDDDFSTFPGRDWRVVSGRPYNDGGVIGSEGPATIALAPHDWRDIAVDVTYRNITSASVSLRANQELYGVVATVRPFHWNEDFSRWTSIALGNPGATGPGARIELNRAESVKSLLAISLHAYPYIALLLIVATLLIVALQLLGESQTSGARPSIPHLDTRYATAVLGVLAFGITLYFNLANFDHTPYVPDSITYIFQAKLVASGHFTAPAPPVDKVFDFFEASPPIFVRDGRWIGQYPIGHPLMLAIGLRLHALWLMPALLASGSIALIAAAGHGAYDRRTGILAAILLLTSPFFLMNAVNFMSHNTAGFYLLACLALIACIDRRPILFAAGAGFFFGMLMNTRPLSAAALTVPFGVFLLWRTLHDPQRGRTGIMQCGAFVAAAAVMLGFYLLYNYATTGDALRSGYQATGVSFFTGGDAILGATPSGGVTGALGVGGAHNYAAGIQNERVQMGLLMLVLHGWPQFVGLTFVLLPFILGTRRAWDWFLLASAVSIMAIWTLYESPGVMYGPRYWYEALPFLILLAARGADRATEILGGLARYVRTRNLDPGPPTWASSGVVYGFVGLLVLGSVWGWMFGQRVTWRADFVPNRASAMCCVLGMDDRIPQLVEQQDLHNALVLVEPCPSFVCYGSVFWRNNPTLDGDIVYARNVAPKRTELLAAYADRTVYVADYMRRTLRALPAEPTRPAAVSTADAASPTPGVAATATP